MYEYFVTYRWYGNWKNSKEGYGNISLQLEKRISNVDDVDKFREIIRKEYPEFDTIIIMFFKEFQLHIPSKETWDNILTEYESDDIARQGLFINYLKQKYHPPIKI